MQALDPKPYQSVTLPSGLFGRGWLPPEAREVLAGRLSTFRILGFRLGFEIRPLDLGFAIPSYLWHVGFQAVVCARISAAKLVAVISHTRGRPTS